MRCHKTRERTCLLLGLDLAAIVIAICTDHLDRGDVVEKGGSGKYTIPMVCPRACSYDLLLSQFTPLLGQPTMVLPTIGDRCCKAFTTNS